MTATGSCKLPHVYALEVPCPVSLEVVDISQGSAGLACALLPMHVMIDA